MWAEKHGKTWRIRDTIGGRKETLVSGLPSMTAARAQMTAMKADQMRGDFIDPRGGKILLSDWIDLWWPMYEASLRAEARKSEGARVRNHILPLLGRFALDELDSMLILKFISAVTAGRRDPADKDKWAHKPLAPKTVRNIHGVLHKILNAAVRQKLIRINPATGTAMPTKTRKEMRFLTPPEVGRLLAATPEAWKPLVTLFLATGLRYSEAVALRAGDVDLMAGTVRVTRALHHGPDGVHFYEDPKTEQSVRTVTIPKDACLAIASVVAGKERDELLFCMDTGKALTRTFRQNTWPRIIEAASLGYCRLHDLRHTHAAMLISANVPLTAVQRRLGHSSIKVTSDLYGHLMPAVDHGIMAAVTSLLPKIDLGGTVGETTGAEQRRTAPNMA